MIEMKYKAYPQPYQFSKNLPKAFRIGWE